MRITARVKPNAKEEAVEKISDTEYVIRVKAPPHEGRANEAVVRALSEYFGIPKLRITIRRGKSGKQKLIDIA